MEKKTAKSSQFKSQTDCLLGNGGDTSAALLPVLLLRQAIDIAMTFLQTIRPLVPFLPTVESPKTKVLVDDRLKHMLVAAVLVCSMSNLPLYGIVRESSPNDPFYHM